MNVWKFAVILFFVSIPVLAQEGETEKNAPQPAVRGSSSVVTLSATVKANQEQPKVLYIVPWQAAQDNRLLYKPLNSQMNRIFSHVERSEHLRELEFISELDD